MLFFAACYFHVEFLSLTMCLVVLVYGKEEGGQKRRAWVAEMEDVQASSIYRSNYSMNDEALSSLFFLFFSFSCFILLSC